MWRFIRRFIRGEAAATAVEYAVMLALILMVALGAIFNFGTTNGGLWGGVSDYLSNAMGS